MLSSIMDSLAWPADWQQLHIEEERLRMIFILAHIEENDARELYSDPVRKLLRLFAENEIAISLGEALSIGVPSGPGGPKLPNIQNYWQEVTGCWL